MNNSKTQNTILQTTKTQILRLKVFKITPIGSLLDNRVDYFYSKTIEKTKNINAYICKVITYFNNVNNTHNANNVDNTHNVNNTSNADSINNTNNVDNVNNANNANNADNTNINKDVIMRGIKNNIDDLSVNTAYYDLDNSLVCPPIFTIVMNYILCNKIDDMHIQITDIIFKKSYVTKFQKADGSMVYFIEQFANAYVYAYAVNGVKYSDNYFKLLKTIIGFIRKFEFNRGPNNRPTNRPNNGPHNGPHNSLNNGPHNGPNNVFNRAVEYSKLENVQNMRELFDILIEHSTMDKIALKNIAELQDKQNVLVPKADLICAKMEKSFKGLDKKIKKNGSDKKKLKTFDDRCDDLENAIEQLKELRIKLCEERAKITKPGLNNM